MDAPDAAFYRSLAHRKTSDRSGADMKLRSSLVAIAAACFISGLGCSSSDVETATGPVGGAVVGPTDDHCADRPDGVSDPAVCKAEPSPEGDAGASGEDEE